MTRFQLIFRHAEGDRPELWDNNDDDDPHIDGKLIVDGETYRIRGVDWIVRSDDIGDAMKRFVCTLAVVPEDDRTSRIA
jgi:hypothetical protein